MGLTWIAITLNVAGWKNKQGGIEHGLNHTEKSGLELAAAKYNILLYGLKTNDPDFDHLNFIITKAVQNFIIQTKRFSKL